MTFVLNFVFDWCFGVMFELFMLFLFHIEIVCEIRVKKRNHILNMTRKNEQKHNTMDNFAVRNVKTHTFQHKTEASNKSYAATDEKLK